MEDGDPLGWGTLLLLLLPATGRVGVLRPESFPQHSPPLARSFEEQAAGSGANSPQLTCKTLANVHADTHSRPQPPAAQPDGDVVTNGSLATPGSWLEGMEGMVVGNHQPHLLTWLPGTAPSEHT